jgi:dihydrofolate reductase
VIQRLGVFNSVSMDGYFTDANNDMSWAHQDDPEWHAFTVDNVTGNGTLLFGRTTYDLMASFWPTPFAMKDFPEVAKRMNNCPKVVFSKTMDEASWANTRVVKDNMAAEVRRLKSEPGAGITILGSGTIVSQLAQEGLIDDYTIAVVPIVLGKGKTLFEGVKEKLRLKLTKSRAFGNGTMVLSYGPAV